MGEVKVPKEALYRAQTQRAVENFPISGTPLEAEHIVALARIKKAAAGANAALGILPKDIAEAISDAADEVIAGRHLEHFPVGVFQTVTVDRAAAIATAAKTPAYRQRDPSLLSFTKGLTSVSNTAILLER